MTIKAGSMVRLYPGLALVTNKKRHGIFTVLRVEQPDDVLDERMALILHPNGETTWEFFGSLEPVT